MLGLNMALGLGRSTSAGESKGYALLKEATAWLASSGLTKDDSELGETDPLLWAAAGAAAAPIAATVDGRACAEFGTTVATNVVAVRDFTGIPVNGQNFVFSVLLHAGTETVAFISLPDGSNLNAAQIDLTTGAIVGTGGGDLFTRCLSFDLGDGWYRVEYTARQVAGSTAQIRIYMRQLTSWTPAGTETLYFAEPSIRMLTASAAVAPSGSTWTQATKLLQPAVMCGAGGSDSVGGAFAESDVYLETSATLNDSELSLAWVGHPQPYRDRYDSHASEDMVLWRASAPSGDKLEILLRNDGSRDRWAVRSTISAAPTTITLTDRGASWATAAIGVSIAGGILTWYVDGEEFTGGSLTIPTGIDTIRAGQMGGGNSGWNASMTDAAAWDSALTQSEHLSVARELLSRAVIAWGDWTVVIVAGQSNAATAGKRYMALDERDPQPAAFGPFVKREETSVSSSPTELQFTPRADMVVTSSDDDPVGQAFAQYGFNIAYPIMVESGAKLCVVELAASGCPLAPASYTWDPGSLDVYTRQVAYYNDIVQDITGATGDSKMVWVHGEADCSSGPDALYQSRLEAFLDQWEVDCGVLSRVIVTSLADTQTGLDTASRDVIRAAQLAVGTARGAYVETNGTSTGDGVHFTPSGKYQVGRAVAAVL